MMQMWLDMQHFLNEFSTQFIIITHRKGTMEAADCLYGVTMDDTGTSKLLSVMLEDKVSYILWEEMLCQTF